MFGFFYSINAISANEVVQDANTILANQNIPELTQLKSTVAPILADPKLSQAASQVSASGIQLPEENNPSTDSATENTTVTSDTEGSTEEATTSDGSTETTADAESEAENSWANSQFYMIGGVSCGVVIIVTAGALLYSRKKNTKSNSKSAELGSSTSSETFRYSEDTDASFGDHVDTIYDGRDTVQMLENEQMEHIEYSTAPQTMYSDVSGTARYSDVEGPISMYSEYSEYSDA